MNIRGRRAALGSLSLLLVGAGLFLSSLPIPLPGWAIGLDWSQPFIALAGVAFGLLLGSVARSGWRRQDIPWPSAALRVDQPAGPVIAPLLPKGGTAADPALAQELVMALERGELEVHYQPMIDTVTYDIVGVEALLRWNHPRKGVLLPSSFVPVAEATGAILDIGVWVLRTACAQAMRWPHLIVAVNVAPAQLRTNGFPLLVRDILGATGLPAKHLELEIGESVLEGDMDGPLEALTALKAQGVHIVLNNFGRSHLGLRNLARFAFDKLKIDRSFIADVEVDERAIAVLSALTALGRSLGMVTAAEGVETAGQLGVLRREGCQQMQGYHLGRPQPAHEIDVLLAPICRGVDSGHGQAGRTILASAALAP